MEERQSHQSSFPSSFYFENSVSSTQLPLKKVTPPLLGTDHLHLTSANRLCEMKNEIAPQFATATSLKDAIAIEVSGKLSEKKALTHP